MNSRKRSENMSIFKKIREKRFAMFCMLLICLFPLVLPQVVCAASTADAVLTVEQVFNKPESSQAADTFTYTLTALESGSPMPAGSSGNVCTFTISGTDSVKLGTITYSTTGTYNYEVKQKVETEQTGYTYDMQVYTLKVYVKSSSDGLKAEVVGFKENGYKTAAIEFVNTYAPLSSDPAAMVDPPVKKAVTGNPSEDGTFTFKLEAEDHSYPMPADSTDGVKQISIVGPGKAEFGTWSYPEAGTYRYTISEVNSKEDGYTYDTMVYTLTDLVKDVNGQLEVERTITNNANESAEAYEFVNQYTSDTEKSGQPGGSDESGKSGSNKGVKTGDYTNIELYQVLLIIAGTVLIVYIICRIKKRKKHSVNISG